MTEAQLAEHIQISTVPSITKSSLLEFHKQRLQNAHTLQSQTSAIISTLGGIDSILTDYLSSNDIELTQSQLQSIHEILDEPVQQSSNDTTISKSPTEMMESDRKSWLYTCSKSNTYLNHYLKQNLDLAAKLKSFAYNKFVITANIIGLFIWLIWGNIEHGKWSTGYLVFRLILFIYLVCHGAVFMLTLNRKIMKKSLRQFVFWFKLYTCFQAAASWLWIRYISVKDRNFGPLEILGDIFGQLAAFMIIAEYAAVDGFQISRKAQIWIGVFISVIWTIDATVATFVIDQDKEAMLHFADGIAVNLIDLRTSSLRVLSIFLWGQVVATMRKSDRCINIKHSPYIEWID